MKRMILLLILLCILVLPVGAASAALTQPPVVDEAGLLTSQEVQNLTAICRELEQKYNFGVYIWVVEDYTDYNSSGIFYACMDIYDAHGYGAGEDKAGTMLMLSMADRDFELNFHSSRADRVFTEYGRDQLEDAVLEKLRASDYYAAFSKYLTLCGRYLEADASGKPVDTPKEFKIWMLLPGLLAAGIGAAILISPMRSVRTAKTADDYLVGSSLKITDRRDIFTNRTVVRTPRETSSSSSGGGSSHRSGSHSGRSGKF